MVPGSIAGQTTKSVKPVGWHWWYCVRWCCWNYLALRLMLQNCKVHIIIRVSIPNQYTSISTVFSYTYLLWGSVLVFRRVLVFVHAAAHTCTHMWRQRTTVAVSSLLSSWLPGSGHLAWWQRPVLMETSHWPQIRVFLFWIVQLLYMFKANCWDIMVYIKEMGDTYNKA